MTKPGDFIGAGNCPVCGAELEIEHGDEPEEIAIIGSRSDPRDELIAEAVRLLDDLGVTETDAAQKWLARAARRGAMGRS